MVEDLEKKVKNAVKVKEVAEDVYVLNLKRQVEYHNESIFKIYRVLEDLAILKNCGHKITYFFKGDDLFYKADNKVYEFKK